MNDYPASRKVKSIAVGIFLAWLISISSTLAAEKPPLEDACLKMDELVNGMLGTQISRCSTSISNRADKYSFFFVAKKPVLNNASDKRVWLLAIVGVVGRAMMDPEGFPSLRGVHIDEVLTFDPDFAKQRRVLALPASSAKRISKDLNDGVIGIDRAYDQIRTVTTERKLN
jgi:hypothetical protein